MRTLSEHNLGTAKQQREVGLVGGGFQKQSAQMMCEENEFAMLGKCQRHKTRKGNELEAYLSGKFMIIGQHALDQL